MNHRKLTEVLRTLGSEQIERLSDFVHSPYFNKSAPVTELFDYLTVQHPDYNQQGVSNSSILNNVKGITDENELAKKMTRLMELTVKFLSMEYNRDDILEQIGTLKAYKKLHLPKHFESLVQQLRKSLNDESFRDFDFLWRAHKLEEESFEGFEKSLLRTPENSLEAVFKSLFEFYLTKKLRYLAEAVSREKFVGSTTQNDVKREVLHFLKCSKVDDDIYLSVYGNLFKMCIEKSPEKAKPYYQKVKATIKAFPDLIPKEEVRSICIYLQNFCLNHINKGNRNYLLELFEIIQFRINRDVLIVQGRINPQQFKIIVGTAIRLKEVSWTKDFIQNFKKYLPEEFRDDYYNFAMGQLLYNQKKITQASRHLAKASHNKHDVYFNFGLKKLQLKIAYESKDMLLLDSHVESYKKHLARYRHKIGENALLLEKFFKYFRMLVNADRNYEKMEILLSKLLTEENFADKDWLISMASGKLKKQFGPGNTHLKLQIN